MTDQMLTRAEAAEWAGVSKATLDRWMRQGKLTRYRVPGKKEPVRIDAEELACLMTPVAKVTNSNSAQKVEESFIA